MSLDERAWLIQCVDNSSLSLQASKKEEMNRPFDQSKEQYNEGSYVLMETQQSRFTNLRVSPLQ